MTNLEKKELRELTHIIMNADTPYDAMQFVKDHTNAEIARVLDRLEKECHSIAMFPDGTGDYEVVPLSAIQAERAKLKEVK